MKKYIKQLFVGLCLLIVFSSCRTRKQNNTQFIRDTVYVQHNSVQRDSIYVLKYDSVIVRTAGDTIFVDRFHVNYKDRFLTKTDTLYKYQERIDHKSEVQEKLVEKKLSWWQKILIWFGAIALIALIVIVALYIISRSWK